uniref:Uncharacterized protein n=1 Tax=Ciona savignyi TaxID=51511 RepID=H2ZBP6_CIOSA
KRNTKEEEPEDAEADVQTDDIPDLKDDTLNQISLHKIRRLERRARRKHRKHLAKVLRRAGLEGEFPDVKTLSIEQIALLASPRKRKSGDNEILLSKLLKKKKRRKTSESYTRMEGFGLKPESGMSKSPITPTSPSFMDMVGPTPTSLFGVGKSPILRGPTQGWPTRIG